jgi:hypothetical protein
MRTFEITASRHSVELKAGARAEVSFTVTSRADHPLVGRTAVRVGEGTDRGWVTVSPDRLQFSEGGTEQVTLTFEVPPGAAPQGRHEVTLVVANEENPDDDWTESAGVAITVGEADDGPSFPWWAVAVGAVVLIVAIGAYATYRLMQRPGFGQPCEPGECAAGLVCADHRDPPVCLGDVGRPCAGGQSECGPHLSCADEAGVRPVEHVIGAPGEGPAAPQEMTTPRVDPGTLECRRPQPLWECDDDLECARTQSCVAVDDTHLCVLEDGQRCRVDLQCASTWCKDGTCTEYTGLCEADADCRDGERCKEGQCLLPLGRPCTSDERCLTGHCEDGVCKEKPDDDPPINPCAGIRCAPGHICIGGRCIRFREFIEAERGRMFMERFDGLPRRP